MDPNEIRNEDKYIQFLNWFKTNGGLSHSLSFPIQFGPAKCLGVCAANTILPNTIFLAIPKTLLITITTVEHSPLQPILSQHEILSDTSDDDRDFNLLTLFLIYETMKGTTSFYHPYLACLEHTETAINWSTAETELIHDPYINQNFLDNIRKQFDPIFITFCTIINSNPQLFPLPLTRILFDKCYSIVMTRCFGWGLPETMLVPFADFLNHHSIGVNHYIFCQELEKDNNKDTTSNKTQKQEKQRKLTDEYIRKDKVLNLEVFGVDNRKNLPVRYELNYRQKWLTNHKQFLIKQKLIIESDDITTLPLEQLQNCFWALRKHQLQDTFEGESLYLSSDSEDNDSEDSTDDQPDHPDPTTFTEKKHFAKLYNQLNCTRPKPYQEPKPTINREFNDGIIFNWWYHYTNCHFIVSSSTPIYKHQQIFNSYGRRNNRFLLIWYGFTFVDNKYDSVAFRLWTLKVIEETGKRVFVRFVTIEDIDNGIIIGNERYSYYSLTSEFRFKLLSLEYNLMAYLRYRVIKKEKYNKNEIKRIYDVIKIESLEIEKEMLKEYAGIVDEIGREYGEGMNNSTEGLKEDRIYFANILKNSNEKIISIHRKGINYCRKIVNKLLECESPVYETLLDIYKCFDENEDDTEQRFDNRMLLREYFQMLGQFIKSINCKTKEEADQVK